MIVVESPNDLRDQKDIRSLQSSIALYNYEQPAPTWEVYIDGRKVTGLPAKAKAGQRITMRDGMSCLGVIPLLATNLGRKDEVELAEGEIQKYEQLQFKAALVINNYNLQQDRPLDGTADWRKIKNAYGGFVIEIADAAEYKDFTAFQRHLAEAKLGAVPKTETVWITEKSVDPATKKTIAKKTQGERITLEVKYVSGDDTMEMGVKTDYQGGPTPQCFTYRRVNGKWPYLAKGLDRDTNLTQQGTIGRLEKNGATLTTRPGLMAYLQTEPISGTYAGFNPLPDPNYFDLAVPGGVAVRTDGKLGIARVVVRPKENRVAVDHGLKDDQHTPEMADCLLLFGFKSEPIAELNGKPVDLARETAAPGSGPMKITTDDGEAYVLPLGEMRMDANVIRQRYSKIREVAAGHFVEKSSGTPPPGPAAR
jgi:hypothetical protein